MFVKTRDGQSLKHRQGGMTTLGLIILVSFIGLFAFAGIRLTPIYLNYMKVVGVVTGVHEELDGTNATRAMIRTSVAKRFDIESVGVITAKDIKVTKQEGGHLVAATYSHKAPFISNVSFVVDFDKQVLVRK
ncbi:MAG: DUF4845 domain-containing protein [Gammaproteobacteria bacterium]|nr:DUF4845 domain-containing protein [Gammaproteobacteria bacterium]